MTDHLDHPSTPHNGEPAHGMDDEIGSPPPTPKTRFSVAIVAFVLAAGVIAGLFYLGWEPRVRQNTALAKEVERQKDTLPRVAAEHPRQSPRISTTLLPGDVQALEETTVYPRTSGYLKRWLVDIGDQVKAGDLLAEIDTPEVDQELNQAEAALGQLHAKQLSAEVNSRLADITLKRFRTLLETKAISEQEYDEHKATYDIAVSSVVGAKADVTAGEANVHRLKDLQSFAKVFAPYDGTITARTIESGYLVSSGNSAAQSLFRLAKTDPVRVFVHVPQMYAVGVKPGLTADIIVRELPDRKFVGTVTRTARAIDPTTRTLLTEIRVPNPDHALLTGSYVQVRMNIERETPPLLLPASALVVNSSGAHGGNARFEQPSSFSTGDRRRRFRLRRRNRTRRNHRRYGGYQSW